VGEVTPATGCGRGHKRKRHPVRVLAFGILLLSADTLSPHASLGQVVDSFHVDQPGL
jgi:hypothetical protein